MNTGTITFEKTDAREYSVMRDGKYADAWIEWEYMQRADGVQDRSRRVFFLASEQPGWPTRLTARNVRDAKAEVAAKFGNAGGK